MRFFPLFILLLFCLSSKAQNITLTGKIFDPQSKQAIPFVNVIVKKSNRGTQTDFDGNFKLENISPNDEIEFVMVGYERPSFKSVDFKNKYSGRIFFLKPTAYNLREVTILPGINPAHRIIEKVLKNKKKNNWEKLDAFTFNSYNKFIVTRDTLDAEQKKMMGNEEKPKPEANSNKGSTSVSISIGGNRNTSGVKKDSVNTANRKKKDKNFKIETHKDTLQDSATIAKNKEKNIVSMDSLFSTTHLFISESVVEKKFKHPDKIKERVVAAKISGTKDLRFSLLNSQFNDFNIYADYIKIFDKNYLSPIAYAATKHYLFVLEDSVYTGNDTIYIISYRPYTGKLFDGFNGVLYINTKKYGVQNVIARPQKLGEGFNTEVRQKNVMMDGKYWFPSELNSKMLFGSISLGKGYMFGKGRTYIKDVVINPELKNREFNSIAMEYDRKAGEKDSSYWQKSRYENLTKQDSQTYKLLDSIGKKENIDTKIKFLETLTSGKFKWKIIDFDLGKIINYNIYEGWRLGAGVSTNSDLSPYFSLGGYYAYGFTDLHSKYGGELRLTPVPGSLFKLGIKYSNDVYENGSQSFDLDKRLSAKEAIHIINISNMYYAEKKEFYFRISPLRYLQLQPSLRQSAEYVRGYSYSLPGGETSNHFQFLETGLGLRYAYNEKFTQILNHRYSNGTSYPILWVQVTKGWLQKNYAETDYLRLDFKTEKTFPIKLAGASRIQVRGGYVWGNVPATRLFDPGSNYVKNYPYASENRFETMRMYEFMADKYAAVFITHSFEKLLFSYKKFNPILELHTNACWGDYSGKGVHNGISFKTPNKGYFESGFSVENIYKSAFSGLGISVHYRYGEYAIPQWQNNFAVKVTMKSDINW